MEPAEPVAPATTTLSKREGRSPRDMALSLAVLLIPIALLLVFYRVVLGGDSPVNVDPAPVLQEAQQAAVFPVAVPTGLSEDWHVSSAVFKRQSDGATLRVGYVDPGKNPMQLVESNVPAETLLPAELGKDAKPTGQYRSTDRAWRLYEARPGEKALVLIEQHRTIILVGASDTKTMEELASSLS